MRDMRSSMESSTAQGSPPFLERSPPDGPLLAPKLEDDRSTETPKRKRASRKGQPKRFHCTYDGCERTYSRAEHLARHQLNHEPKEVFRCEVDGCGHTFVRPDLFARHKARHEELSEQQTNVETRSNDLTLEAVTSDPQLVLHDLQEDEDRSDAKRHKPSLPGSEPTALSTTLSSVWQPMPQAQSLVAPMATTVLPQLNAMDRQLPPLSSLAPINNQWLAQTAIPPFNEDLAADQSTDNFATWLFDSPGSHNSGFDFNNIPFLDFGMDYSMSDMWGLDESGMQDLLGNRTYSSNSVTSEPRLVELEEDPHIRVSEDR